MPKFIFSPGVKITNPDGVEEGFSVQATDQNYSTITINVSLNNLKNTILGLAELVTTPGFAIVEIPSHKDVEDGFREKSDFHNDTYYLEGISYKLFKQVFKKYSKFFLADGNICFGFSSHIIQDEVFVGRYKIIYIHSANPEKYIRYLEAHRFIRREKLYTVWNTITAQTPAGTYTVEIQGYKIYDLRKILIQDGFRFIDFRKA